MNAILMVENITENKSRITINVCVKVKAWKNIMSAKKDNIWNPATCSCKNSKCAWSITDDSVITCDEIIDTTKSTSTKPVSAKSTSTDFYILLTFLLITIALLMAFSIYWCFIKCWTKQKHLLLYCGSNEKLK